MATYDESAADTLNITPDEGLLAVLNPVVSDTATGTDAVTPQYDLYLQVVAALTGSTAVDDTPIFLWPTDGVALSSTTDNTVAFALSEGILIESSAAAQQIFAIYADEGVSIRGTLKYIAALFAADGVSMTAGVAETINRMLRAAEVLRATGVVSGLRASHIAVVAGVLAEAVAQPAWELEASEVAQLTDDLEVLRDVMLEALETASVAESATGTVSFVVVAEDELEVGATVSDFIEFFLNAEDVIDFRAALTTPGGQSYVAWVTNLKGAAPYEYTNFEFNSFAVIGDMVLACKNDGIYELTGDTDDGDPIQVAWKTGLMDFGSPYMKRMTDAILAYSSDGDMILRVTTTDEGYKQEYYYTVSDTHGVVKEGRVKLGKGARARYWQFELENVDGADIDLDSMIVVPVTLRRRV